MHAQEIAINLIIVNKNPRECNQGRELFSTYLAGDIPIEDRVAVPSTYFENAVDICKGRGEPT